MRAFISALSCFSLIGLLLLVTFSTGFSQDRPEAAVSRDLRREWYDLARGRFDFEVSELSQVPRSLSLAANHYDCDYAKGLEMKPIHFLRSANRRLAIVACWKAVKSHQQVFDLSDLQKPIELQFPTAAYPDGFTASNAAPGLLTWDREADVFRAETASDMVPSPRARYTYRLDGMNAFTVLRVEFQRADVEEWTTIWDAPRWSSLTKPN
jgi:hypothetical protein